MYLSPPVAQLVAGFGILVHTSFKLEGDGRPDLQKVSIRGCYLLATSGALRITTYAVHQR